MLKSSIKIIIATLFMFVTMVQGQQLNGVIGKSSQWGSGWINLQRATNFINGDTLIIRVGGTARKVLVRLLSIGEDPDSPSGIIGEYRIVSANRIIEVILESDYNQIKQISVHGGTNPFNFSLGENNGPATLRSARLKRPRH